MKHTKRLKQARHSEIELINRKSSRIFKGSIQLIYINILILTAFGASSAVTVDVTWDAKLPAFFGTVTYLQCEISDVPFNCSKSPRQWYGGPNYGSLCYEDKCRASNKYQVMNQSRCQYTLMIHDFSDRDVNCEYTCLYGISNMRRNLTLDEMKFIYKPQIGDITEETLEKDKTLYLRINISKIFPKPSCGADLNGESITNNLQILFAKPGFYFSADLHLNVQSSSCGKLDVYCYLGDFKINITSKNFDSCHLQGEENSQNNGRTVMVAVIISTIIPVVLIFMICIYREKKLCFNNNNYDGRRVQYRPTQN